jgi:hypothetical protein
VSDRKQVPVPLESAAWIAHGVRYRAHATADPPNQTIRRLPKHALIIWAVIYSPAATQEKPIQLSLNAARHLPCCEAAPIGGGDWELAGTGDRHAYSVVVRIYFGSPPTTAMRPQAASALRQLQLPPAR